MALLALLALLALSALALLAFSALAFSALAFSALGLAVSALSVRSAEAAGEATSGTVPLRRLDRSHGNAGRGQVGLGLGDADLAEMEDRRGQHRIGPAHHRSFHQVLHPTHPSA